MSELMVSLHDDFESADTEGIPFATNEIMNYELWIMNYFQSISKIILPKAPAAWKASTLSAQGNALGFLLGLIIPPRRGKSLIM